MPRTSGRPRHPPVPWWTEACKDAILKRRRALRKFDKNCTTTNLIAFRQARAVARRTIMDAKRESWRAYIYGLNRSSRASEIFAQIKRIAGRTVATPLPVLCIRGAVVTDPVDVADNIGQALAERCCIDRSNPQFARERILQERFPVDFQSSEVLSYNEPFTMQELQAAIGLLKPVSEGPDLVSNDMIKLLPPCALEAVLGAFNMVWRDGIFPAAWREAIVVPVLKPGKTGLDPLHYRPISLTSSLCKLLERMVHTRLTWYLEHCGVLSRIQCGFRKHRSTIDHMISLDTEVRLAFKERRHLGAIFFDIQGAYDTTWRHGILMKAHRCDFRGRMGHFIQNFLQDRSFRVRVGGYLSDTFVQHDGIPQGSVLSVDLFSLAINDIDHALPNSIGRALFADDFTIWLSAHGAPTLSRQLQTAVGRLEAWCAKNGFMFSASKTVAMHFCRRRRHCPDMALQLHGKTIPCVQSTKVLGLTLDTKLRYTDHIRDLRERCFKALNVMKCVSCMTYGADRDTLLLLYRSFVRSKLDYASLVYDGASETVKKPLDTVHHTAMRIVTGAFRTTPSASLLAEVGEPPLALRRAMLGLRYAIKLRVFPDHPSFPYVFSRGLVDLFGSGRPQSAAAFCLRVERMLAESPLSARGIRRWEHPEIPPWQLTRPIIDTTLTEFRKRDTPVEQLRSATLERINGYTNCDKVYTDGSKTSSGVGCAFVSGDTTRSFTLPTHASVYTAELVAIQKALCFIEVGDIRRHLILSDSLSCVLSIGAFNPPDQLVQDIAQKLSSLQHCGKDITICWIPSHTGVSGNDKADAAAKRAAEQPVRRSFPLPARDLYQHISQFIKAKWQSDWSDRTENKLREIKPLLGRWTSSGRKSRREEVSLFRLRAGHIYDTHRYLLCGEVRPRCQRCGSYLSVKHILTVCPSYQRERQRFFGRREGVSLLTLLGDDSPYISNVLAFAATVGLKIIYDPR